MYKNLKNDQRGIAHLLLIVVAAVVIGVAVFAGMKVMSTNKDKDSKSSATGVVANKEVADACNKELHDKDLCKFASNYKLDGLSYEVVITNTQDGKTSVTTMQIDGKNNSSLVTTEDGAQTGAYISLNKAVYNKDLGTGTWTKFSTATDTAATPTETKPADNIDFNTSDLTENNTISYKKIGKEACGNLSCYKYQVVDSQNPGTTQYIWFDTKDYVMRHWYSKDSANTTDMVITYRSVNIKEPSPVKEFSAESGAAAAQAAAAAAAAADYSSDDYNQE